MIEEIFTAIFYGSIPNYFISRKMDRSVHMTQGKIDCLYYEYQKNLITRLILNGLFISVSVVSGLAASIRETGIVIASLLLIILGGRTLYLVFRWAKKLLIYREQISDFLSLFVKNHSFQKTVKTMIRCKCEAKYSEMTNVFTARLHSFCAGIGIIKPAWKIEDEFVERYYRLIRDYLIGNILCKILIIFVSYAVFILFLRPLTVHVVLGMKLAEIVIYPVRMLRLFH